MRVHTTSWSLLAAFTTTLAAAVLTTPPGVAVGLAHAQAANSTATPRVAIVTPLLRRAGITKGAHTELGRELRAELQARDAITLVAEEVLAAGRDASAPKTTREVVPAAVLQRLERANKAWGSGDQLLSSGGSAAKAWAQAQQALKIFKKHYGALQDYGLMRKAYEVAIRAADKRKRSKDVRRMLAEVLTIDPTFSIGRNRTESAKKAWQRAQAEAKKRSTCTLAVDAPRGAMVWLDGVKRGTVGDKPLPLAALAAGTHYLKVTLEGALRWSKVVKLRRGQQRQVPVKMTMRADLERKKLAPVDTVDVQTLGAKGTFYTAAAARMLGRFCEQLRSGYLVFGAFARVDGKETLHLFVYSRAHAKTVALSAVIEHSPKVMATKAAAAILQAIQRWSQHAPVKVVPPVYLLPAADDRASVVRKPGKAGQPSSLARELQANAKKRPPKEPPLLQRWWFWAVAGATVATVVGVVVATQADSTPASATSFIITASLPGGK